MLVFLQPGQLAYCPEPEFARFRENGAVGAGGDGGRSVGRRDGASRSGVVFYVELHCFRRFLKVYVDSAAIFARVEVTIPGWGRRAWPQPQPNRSDSRFWRWATRGAAGGAPEAPGASGIDSG